MAGPFRKLIMRLILERAIIFEERAYRFYESALSLVGEGQTSGLLKKLMAAELGHRMKLEEIQKSGVLGTVYEDGVDTGEDENFEMISGKWPEIAPGMSKKEILDVALSREKIACSFYRKLHESSKIEVAKELFEMLACEESDHVSWISREIVGITK
jgi:rubrerythrin